MVKTLLMINAIGFLAGAVQTTRTIPQLVSSIKRKSTKDLSFWMIFLGLAGAFLWLIYACIVRSIPIIVTDSISSLLLFTLLMIKIKFNNPRDCGK